MIFFLLYNSRIIRNYEHYDGDFIPLETIMEHLKNEEETANEICIGHVIANLWSKKVKKKMSVTKRGSGYENLRRRAVKDYDEMSIREINEERVKKLK